jgi:hypothetical protein
MLVFVVHACLLACLGCRSAGRSCTRCCMFHMRTKKLLVLKFLFCQPLPSLHRLSHRHCCNNLETAQQRSAALVVKTEQLVVQQLCISPRLATRSPDGQQRVESSSVSLPHFTLRTYAKDAGVPPAGHVNASKCRFSHSQ